MFKFISLDFYVDFRYILKTGNIVNKKAEHHLILLMKIRIRYTKKGLELNWVKKNGNGKNIVCNWDEKTQKS